VRVRVARTVRKVNRTGVPGSVASGCAGDTVPFKSAAFLGLGDEPDRRAGCGWKPYGRHNGAGHRALRPPRARANASWTVRSRRLSAWCSHPRRRSWLPWNENLPGGRHRPESGWPRTRWGSGPPRSSSGRRAAGAATGFEDPRRPTRPRGSTPPSSAGHGPAGEGAALIRR
jgi:hypothetical protein